MFRAASQSDLGCVLIDAGTDGMTASLQEPTEHFQRYLWRQGQSDRLGEGMPATSSFHDGLSSAGEEEEEPLPSSLSGMARHFQARIAARALRRVQSLATTRCFVIDSDS